MSVKIREKRGKLYLDIYQGGKRTWVSLHLKLTNDRAQNKEIMRLAEICRSKRETQFLTGEWDINDPIAGKISLTSFMEEYSKNYKNPSTILSCMKYVKDFQVGNIQLIQVTSKWIDDFQKFLLKQDDISRGTAGFYARLLRSILNRAVDNGVITRNPASTVQKITSPEPEMIFLSFDELKTLAAIKLDDKYAAEVRRAFLFACYTGLRISDIETLTWSKITNNPMQVIKVQEKTMTNVFIPLSKSAQALIVDGKKHAADDLVFDLKCHNRRATYNHLSNWVETAGLEKTIGWHTARRTFATMALESGADIHTVAKLLGHVGLAHFAKYAKVSDKRRGEAIAALPELAM